MVILLYDSLAGTLLDCFFFGHVFSLFGFAIKARPRLPILPALCVHPNLIGTQWRPRRARRSKACWAVSRSSCPPFLNHLPAKARRIGSEGNPETGSGPFATSRSGGEKTGNEMGSSTGGTERGTGGKRSASRLIPKSLRKVSKVSAKLKRRSPLGLGMAA